MIRIENPVGREEGQENDLSITLMDLTSFQFDKLFRVEQTLI
jgi:hypothetical protein